MINYIFHVLQKVYSVEVKFLIDISIHLQVYQTAVS